MSGPLVCSNTWPVVVVIGRPHSAPCRLRESAISRRRASLIVSLRVITSKQANASPMRSARSLTLGQWPSNSRSTGSTKSGVRNCTL